MVLGDATDWAARFISMDERILRRIVVVWPQCLAVLSANPTEDTITINLIKLLCNDAVVRRICHWIEFQFEPFGIDEKGAAFSKGAIDMAVLLDWERTRYVAYECKRLNVLTNGVKASLATRYVTEGVKRFVTEQYAEALPVGCMLGYILDGDADSALASVRTAIGTQKATVGLIAGPAAIAPIETVKRFGTTHTRGNGKANIEVRHALLAFPAMVPSAV